MACASRWSCVSPGARSAVVQPYGHSTSSEYVCQSIAALICWTPPTTRELTKSRTRCVSGAENADGPRYVSDDVVPDEPPQQPHCQLQLRLRSVPTADEPAFGCRFLRHDR